MSLYRYYGTSKAATVQLNYMVERQNIAGSIVVPKQHLNLRCRKGQLCLDCQELCTRVASCGDGIRIQAYHRSGSVWYICTLVGGQRKRQRNAIGRYPTREEEKLWPGIASMIMSNTSLNTCIVKHKASEQIWLWTFAITQQSLFSVGPLIGRLFIETWNDQEYEVKTLFTSLLRPSIFCIAAPIRTIDLSSRFL